MTRVLVVSSEPVGERMAGPAIRAWELARVLASSCDVTLAAPAPSTVDDPRVMLVEAGFEDHDALLGACLAAEVVVAQQLPTRMLARLAGTDVRIVADLYNPTVMEVLEATAGKEPSAARRTERLVARRALAHCAVADLVICASEQQRDLWLGGMAMAGLIDPESYAEDPSYRSRVDVVPFGLAADPPVPSPVPLIKGVMPGIAAQDRVLLWGGGVWGWLDPITVVRAVAALQDRPGPRTHLVFLGTKRPAILERDDPSVDRDVLAFAEREGLLGRCVHVREDWVPYEQRGGWLLEADVGVSAHHDHLEARFAFRTRILDYLWAGLPVVCTGGDALGDLVERRGLGAAVPAGDAEAYARACAEMLDDQERRAAVRSAIASVAPELTWERIAAPLVRFCVAPTPRRRARGTLRAATLAQYPDILADTFATDGLGGAARRVGRNLGRFGKP